MEDMVRLSNLIRREEMLMISLSNLIRMEERNMIYLSYLMKRGRDLLNFRNLTEEMLNRTCLPGATP